MSHRLFSAAFAFLALVIFACPLPGCGSDADYHGVDADGSHGGDHDGHAHGEGGGHEGHAHGGDHPAGGAAADTIAIEKALASLSPEDRAAAQKQKQCPVGDEPLGSMGPPLKITVNGQDVFLCCQGCEGDLRKNPDKYLAKLNAQE